MENFESKIEVYFCDLSILNFKVKLSKTQSPFLDVLCSTFLSLLPGLTLAYVN